MTATIRPHRTEVLRRAAAQAVLAPSVHNTQPWRFTVEGSTLTIRADWSRHLRVLDPSGRQLLISCGCALFNARVALAAHGYDSLVDRLPGDGSDARPTVVARLTIEGEPTDRLPLSGLDASIEHRQTNRRRFADDPVAGEFVEALIAAAAAEGAALVPLVHDDQRRAAATLSQQADHEQNADPAYRAEIRSWTTNDSVRRDGVPALAVPHLDAGANDDLPIRDFDTHGMGWLPVETHSTMDQCLLLLCTPEDDPGSWIRAGEALERVLLEVTRNGYSASPLTQVVEIPRTRQELRERLALELHPDVLLRVGRAPRTPASRRRELSDVLDVTT